MTDIDITRIRINPEFADMMKQQLAKHLKMGDQDDLKFLELVNDQIELLVDTLAYLVPFINMTEQALLHSTTVNQHFINDWSMLSGNIEGDLGVSQEIFETMQLFSQIMVARENFDNEEHMKLDKNEGMIVPGGKQT